ncbi:tRNA dimethylallyltransferase [Candidatus Falkowbacteria bacterium]|nr:tRNA dimethylallyltransferase [Candidatus Falkowbacteria bacterium]
MPKRKVIIILGPTGSGKSDVALKLAKKCNGFLISADSRQIYKGMDIGTNKDIGAWQVVDGEERYLVEGVPLYLVDQLEPDQEFTVVDWKNQVIEIINSNPDKLPIIVGGTGLYISALVNNFSFANVKRDDKNPRHALRTREDCMTGNPLGGKPLFDFLQIGINIPREALYKKIDSRVDKMMADGLLDEVKKLNQQGFSWDLTSISGIGYKQIGMFLRGEITLEQAIDLIKRDTRHYAKRQMTWFKRDSNIKWVKNFEEAEEIACSFLAGLFQKIFK